MRAFALDEFRSTKVRFHDLPDVPSPLKKEGRVRVERGFHQPRSTTSCIQGYVKDRMEHRLPSRSLSDLRRHRRRHRFGWTGLAGRRLSLWQCTGGRWSIRAKSTPGAEFATASTGHHRKRPSRSVRSRPLASPRRVSALMSVEDRCTQAQLMCRDCRGLGGVGRLRQSNCGRHPAAHVIGITSKGKTEYVKKPGRARGDSSPPFTPATSSEQSSQHPDGVAAIIDTGSDCCWAGSIGRGGPQGRWERVTSIRERRRSTTSPKRGIKGVNWCGTFRDRAAVPASDRYSTQGPLDHVALGEVVDRRRSLHRDDRSTFATASANRASPAKHRCPCRDCRNPIGSCFETVHDSAGQGAGRSPRARPGFSRIGSCFARCMPITMSSRWRPPAGRRSYRLHPRRRQSRPHHWPECSGLD